VKELAEQESKRANSKRAKRAREQESNKATKSLNRETEQERNRETEQSEKEKKRSATEQKRRAKSQQLVSIFSAGRSLACNFSQSTRNLVTINCVCRVGDVGDDGRNDVKVGRFCVRTWPSSRVHWTAGWRRPKFQASRVVRHSQKPETSEQQRQRQHNEQQPKSIKQPEGGDKRAAEAETARQKRGVTAYSRVQAELEEKAVETVSS
jgi:hypothetical protein